MKYNVAFKHGAASELNTAMNDLVFVKNERTNLYEWIFQVSDMCRVCLSNKDWLKDRDERAEAQLVVDYCHPDKAKIAAQK